MIPTWTLFVLLCVVASGSCDWGTSESFNNRTLVYVNEPANFFGAHYNCWKHGKELLVVTDADEVELLRNRLRDLVIKEAIWLAAVNLGERDRWVWLKTQEDVTGIHWDYKNNQPNDPNNQHCLGIGPGGHFDMACHLKYTYYCQDASDVPIRATKQATLPTATNLNLFMYLMGRRPEKIELRDVAGNGTDF